MIEAPRLFVRLFKPQFAALVEQRIKRQTVRPTPKRMPRPGDRISLRAWTGLPYRTPQRVLLESIVTSVEAITFTRLHRIQFQDGILRAEEEYAFARDDGFFDAAEMFAWFEREHGLPFSGVLIEWS